MNFKSKPGSSTSDMRIHFPILICSLLLSFIFIGHSWGGEWQPLDRGLSYQAFTFKKEKRPNTPPYQLHIFRIDPRFFSFKPVLATPEKYASIHSMITSTGALLGTNANFFDARWNPLGIVIQDGRLVRPLKNISWWGVFYMEKGKPHIVKAVDFKNSSGISMALEAGPRLVMGGRPLKLKRETSPKTAIGIGKKGEIYLLASIYPLEINELARLMAKAENKGGLGCVTALNFDGGSSTQMYAHIKNFELKLPSYVGVPVGIGVFRR